MAKISFFIFSVTLWLLSALPALAAQGEVRTCALSQGLECLPGEGCQEWTMEDLSLPRFVRVDLKARTMTSLDKEFPRSTKIVSVESLEGMTVLHGTEQRGWSMAIDDNSGDFTLSASGSGVAFVVFGSCLTP